MTETSLPICLRRSVKLNRKPLTSEAARSGGGGLRETRLQFGASAVSHRKPIASSLIRSLSARRKPVNSSSRGPPLRALSLSFLLISSLYQQQKPSRSDPMQSPGSISAPALALVPSSSPPPRLLLLDSVIPGQIRPTLSLARRGVTPRCRYVAA